MKITHQHKQALLMSLGCMAIALSLPACQQEGSAEKAGQKVDKAVESVGQNIEDTTVKAGRKMDAVKQSVTEQSEKTGVYIDESVTASESSLEKAGKQIDQAINKAGNQIDSAKEAVVDTGVATGEYFDDSAITANIKASMIKDEFLQASQIEVTTVNGVVTLSGTVDSEQLVARAIGLANSQEHVKSVQNQLMIKSDVPSQQ
ncbi:MAG: BON domain-containing protein [Methylomonas sp.]|nr:BON domain-containing protein [Methylomonas sp.]